MEKKRKYNRLLVAAIAAAFVAALAVPASAEVATTDQTVDATLAESLTLSLSQTAVGPWALAANSLTNTTAAGTMTVSTNGITYSVTVQSEKATLTEHDGAGYVATTPKTLGAALSVTAKVGTTTTGTATVTNTAATALIPATTTGLGTHTYDLTFTQPTTFADRALPTGRTYHNRLTYTATSVI